MGTAKSTKKTLRMLAAVTAAVISLCACSAISAQEMSIPLSGSDEYKDYVDYFSGAEESAADAIKLLPESASALENAELVPREDNGGNCLDIAEGGSASWKITGEPGWYSVRINYYPGECRSSYASVSVKINGEIPFAEAGGISLSCIYADKDGIRQDYYGNDIRSSQSLAPRWETTYLYDTERYENSPLCFYLENTDEFSVGSVTGNFSVSLVELVPYSGTPDYADTLKEYSALGYTEISDSFDLYEAENYFLKSDPTVVPVSDSSSSVTPHDNFLMKLNTVSGSNWKTAGQFIIWKINVKQAGLYRITLKVKQDFREGLYSTRRLYINGEIPFAEANAVRFIYTGGWVNMTLGDEQNGDWLFYFEEGENEIKLEAVLGEMGGALREVSDIVDSLNTIYREILAVTGASPDSYRDYSLDKLVPEVLESISVQKKRLEEVRDSFEAVTGKKGGDLSVFDTLIKQLGSFEEDPDNIPPAFSYFKTNIGSLGTWYTSALSQPLSMDSFIISGKNNEIPEAEANIFKKIADSIISFISSFIVDYNNIGNMSDNSGKPVKVWMTSGRDQMQVLKTMIQNSFVQESGINVQLENVDTASVLKAVFAGNGPDVLLGAAVSDPVNYALRNAVYDLNTFDGIDEIRERFYPETLVPLSFGGSLYALPETVTFPLLFYRADILGELEQPLPETWDDVIELISVLQKNNMTFGLPSSLNTYSSFMFQYGGEMYAGNGQETLLSSQKNADAFELMVNFYSNYSLDLQYDFVNRFRTGEMPVAVAEIGSYNNLKVSAPEIDGLWGIALLPGIKNEDGTINRSGCISATASILLKGSKQPEKAFEFLDWWSSADVQSQFGKEIESILGPSSRYLTANREAFETLPWTESEIRVIDGQISVSSAVEEVPGSYYLSRHFNNALRAVLIKDEDIKDTLDKYTADINKELSDKRSEFGLE